MNEAFYKSIAAQSPFAYAYHKIILDKKGMPCDYLFLEVNPAFEKATGLLGKNILGKTVRTVIPGIGEDSFDWIATYGKIALNGGEATFEQFSKPLQKWYRIKAYSPEPLHFITQFTDITDEKNNVINLEEFFSASPDLLLISELSGRVVRFNSTWHAIMGYTESEFTNTNIYKYIHPDDAEATRQAVKLLHLQKGPPQFTNRYLDKAGAVHYIEWKARTLGQYIFSIGRDVSRQTVYRGKMNVLLQASERLQTMHLQRLDYEQMCRDLRQLTDAKYVLFSVYSEESRQFKIAAIAGDSSVVGKAGTLLGQKLMGSRWLRAHRHATGSKDEILDVFNDLQSLTWSILPDLVIRALETLLNTGQTALCRIFVEKELKGVFAIFMPLDIPLRFTDFIRLYARQVSLLFARISFEANLQDKEALLSEAQRMARMGSWKYDIAADMVTWSSGAALIYDLPAEKVSMSRADFNQLVHPDDRNAVSLADEEHFAGKKPYEMNFRIVTGRGEVRWVHETGQTVMDETGRPEYQLGTVQDITQIMAAADEIKKLLKENETIFNGTQDALFLVQVLENGQFRYLRSNASYNQKLGVQLEGKTPEEVWGSRQAKSISDHYARCLREKTCIFYEEQLELPKGKLLFATTLTPIFENGKPAYIVGSRVDITQKRQSELLLQQNLHRSEMLVRLFRYDAASVHDFLDFALQQALDMTQSKVGYIYLYDETTQQFTLNSWSKNVMPQCAIAQKDSVYQLENTGIWGEAVRQRRTIILNDFQAPHPLKKGYPEGHVSLTKYMTLPIFSRGHIVAVVGVGNKKMDYTHLDAVHLSLLMENAWAQVERMKAERKLKEEKERFRITLLSVGDGVLSTDKYGNIETINDVSQRLTGWSREQAAEQAFEEVFHIVCEATGLRCDNPVQKVISTGEISTENTYVLLLSRDGGATPVHLSASPIKDEKGALQGVVVVFRDVTQDREKQNRIEYLSYHDQLTGLFNRRYYQEEADRLQGQDIFPMGIIMADVNGLKLTNDAFGHTMGDRLLQETARLLTEVCPPDSTVARLGGDEFVILLPYHQERELETIVKQIRLRAAQTAVGNVQLSVSLGYDVKIKSKQDLQDVLKNAEDYMYRRKLFESPSMRGRTIQTIIHTLYEKNRREERHSERVSQLAEAIGQALSMDERSVSELKMAGLLHDIGKIAIAEHILNKKDILTEAEWNEIKRHPEIGYRILSAGNDMAELAGYVLEHHERWDGNGYPKGIKETEISLQGRILAIADAFDAMTHSRTYRAVIPSQEAAQELRRSAGTQFDPQLVDIFIEKVLPRLPA